MVHGANEDKKERKHQHESSPVTENMTRPATQFDYLGRNGTNEIRVLGFYHERTCFYGASRTIPARPYRRPFARMAPAPSSEPARSGWRCRDIGAPFEFRRNRPGCAVPRDGHEAGRTVGGALARTQRIAGGGGLRAGVSAPSPQRSRPEIGPGTDRPGAQGA